MAISSSSTVKEILENPEALAIAKKYSELFDPSNEALMACAGMKVSTLIRFPQSGMDRATQQAFKDELDALGK